MSTPTRITFIDGMRFLAAALVMAQHYLEHRDGPVSEFFRVHEPGIAAVALFFFVSGFIIPMSVTRGFNPIDFVIRRIARIYPLYLVCLIPFAFYQVTGIGLATRPDYGVRQWVAAILLISEYVGEKPIIPASWTLPIEFMWYMIFAAFVSRFRSGVARRLEYAVVGIVTAAIIASLSLGLRVPAGRIFMLYAAMIGYRTYLLSDGTLRPRTFLISVAVFIGLLVPAFYLSFNLHPHPRTTFTQALFPWLGGLAFFLAVALIPRLRNSRALCNPVTSYLGATSYSIYLIHGPTYDAAKSVLPSQYVIPVAVVATLALASATYWLVEMNGIELGREISKRLKHRAPTLAVGHI